MVEKMMVHAESRELFLNWMEGYIISRKNYDNDYSEDKPYLKIECDCGKEYKYSLADKIPKRSVRCKCGIWIIKYGKKK